MVRLLFAVLFVTLAAPVAAQDEIGTPSLFAAFAAGLIDGGTISMSPLGKATVREPQEGVFAIGGADKQGGLFTFTEPEPCVVQLTAKVTPPQPGHMTADLRQISDIKIEENGSQDGFPGWRVTISGPEGAFKMITPERTQSLDELTTTIYTSVPLEAMQEAADVVRERCAGMPIIEPATSPVDLLAIVFTGVAEGARINLGRDGGQAIKVFDGLYTIEPIGPGEAPIRLAITQTGRCTFGFDLEQEGQPPIVVRLDAGLIDSIIIEDNGARGELHGYKITITGGDGRVILEEPDGTERAADPATYLTTSLSLEEMQAAAGTFRAVYCPGPAP